MLVQVVMPDPGAARVVRRALLADDEIEVAESPAAAPDVRLVHASLLPHSRGDLRQITQASSALVVADAPNDPATLADYLAAGVNGYHRRGEPWSVLPEVVRDVHAGGYRCEPSVVAHLLSRYRALVRRSVTNGNFGHYLH